MAIRRFISSPTRFEGQGLFFEKKYFLKNQADVPYLERYASLLDTPNRCYSFEYVTLEIPGKRKSNALSIDELIIRKAMDTTQLLY
jgi:hypothetical protein